MDSQSWTGTGSLVFGGGANTLTALNATNALTVGPEVTIRGKTVNISGLGSFTNQGTRAVDVAGAAFLFTSRLIGFGNTGTVRAAAGTTLRLPGENLTNLTNTATFGQTTYATLRGGPSAASSSKTTRPPTGTRVATEHSPSAPLPWRTPSRG